MQLKVRIQELSAEQVQKRETQNFTEYQCRQSPATKNTKACDSQAETEATCDENSKEAVKRASEQNEENQRSVRENTAMSAVQKFKKKTKKKSLQM